MRVRLLLAAASLLATAHPAAAQDAPPAGIWTNTEDQYFAAEEGRERPEWAGFEVEQDGRWRTVDAFRQPDGEWQTGGIPGVSRGQEQGWNWRGSELRRARDFTCWISVRKFAGKPDGSEDWTFVGGQPIFDQGGRVFVAGKGAAPDVTFRLRNVTWAKGSRNKPALVLYVHRDDLDRAESYGWAAPDSSMVGVNLRWVQGSCSRIDGLSEEN